MILQTIAVFLLLYLFYRLAELILSISSMKRMTSKIPQADHYPIVGSLLHLDNSPDGFPLSMVARANRFARLGFETMHVWLLHKVFVTGYYGRVMKPILDSNEEIVKGNEYDIVTKWLGKGLLTSTGDRWRAKRRMLTPTFHFSMLDSYVYSMNRHARVFADEILVDHVGSESIVDLYPLIKNCALDIICETAMGKDLNSQRNPDNEYVATISTIMRTAVDFVIAERIESVRKGEVETNRRAFLDMLIELMDKESLSMEDLREEVDTFMFAGHDTTAAGMAWTIWCLACNPHIQERAAQEIRKVFRDDVARDAMREDLTKMTYLEACIKESLRLFPPVILTQRMLQNDFDFGGHTVPKGSTLSISPIVIHRNEQIYENALKYDPDRFMPENSEKRHAYDFIPFSAGPRNCIGQKFAMYEEKVVLSWLLRRYTFTSDRNMHDNMGTFEVIYKPTLGVPVRIERRT